MTVEFLVLTASRIDRELKKLVAYHPELPDHYTRIVAALKQDPYNRSTGISSRNSRACRPVTGSAASGQAAFDSVTTSKASPYI